MSLPAEPDGSARGTALPADVPADRGGRAAALARRHRAIDRRGRWFLPPRDVAELERRLFAARRRCREAGSVRPAARLAADWLLDNDWLLRRVLGQLRRELPAGFQRKLPTLAGGGPVRALEIAEEVHREAARDLELAEVERFLEAYQRITPLTIAELWALPALLRLVILRDLLGTLDAVRPGAAPPDDDPAGTEAGRAVRALRLLAEIHWKEVFSRHSATDHLLRSDPAGAYAVMDFETRDAYRRVVEEVASAAGCSEPEVAGTALALSSGHPDGDRRQHVGYHLVGEGRRLLERALDCRVRSLERTVLDHPKLVFFGSLATLQLALVAPAVAYAVYEGASAAMAVLAAALAWIPASVPTSAVVRWALARVVRPRSLPKLDLGRGIPEKWRTLVVVPTLLGDRAQIDRVVERLELHHLANPDPRLRFALLTDHMDSDRPTSGDDPLLAHAVEAVRALERRHGGDGATRFHLLHRSPRWNAAEGKWMGWERKRGKIEELNRWLLGDGDTTYSLHVGDPEALRGVVFVLTLDSDTQLPAGAAARLVGTLAHPLNRPEVGPRGRVVAGYTVLQPRVEVSPRSAGRSAFTRWFSGDTGLDIYTRAVSETYQDLFGEGIYVGKGIYDVEAFHRTLHGRVPENALLSHDLFEGVHGRTALVTDVVVYEDYPSHYPAYLRRLHRWVRGDWQLLPWLLPHVPVAGGVDRNRLGVVDRFKIVDNMRRSLVSSALVAFLAAGWLFLPGHPAVWTLAALAATAAVAVSFLVRQGIRGRHELARSFLAVSFAPQEAVVSLDGVVRVLVRMAWTRRRLLEWTTAEAADEMLEGAGRRAYLAHLWAAPAVAAAIGVTVAAVSPGALPFAAPFLLLWLASPEIAWRVSRPVEDRAIELDEASKLSLRLVARRTWLFFETFVGPVDNWLPIDHFQEHPRGVAAHRTSPTNIGMLLTSQLAAWDLGYIGRDALASWTSNTLDALERLERYRGHIFNWYETRTLEPLQPCYVSTVDSGNLAGALLTLAIGCEEAASAPADPARMRAGLRDTAALLLSALEELAGDAGRMGPARRAPPPVLVEARTLVERLGDPRLPDAEALDDARRRVKTVEDQLLASLRGAPTEPRDPAVLRELRLWLSALLRQVGEAAREAERRARGDGRAADGEGTRDPATDALGDPAERLRAVGRRARAFAEGMDFGFLYDPERRFFQIGYNASVDRLDPHHYDLLASEARLASFVAITRGDVPLEHWFALGRPLMPGRRHRRTLLSWGGSMFEYLMPRLFMRSHPNTLLAASYAGAVATHIEYGRAHDVPWGVSESGYALLDGHQAYQYRAFGVPGLGLRRGLEEDVVVAPYASLLALAVRPDAVAKNLERLAALGALGRFGFYEAVDFHPRRAPGRQPALVRSYMSHHHGMGLVAIANLLTDDRMVRRFHTDPFVRSGELLLDERIPPEIPPELPTQVPASTTDVGLVPLPSPAWEPDPDTPQVWALGNGSLSSFVTPEGGGGLRRRGLTVSRWEPDAVTERQCRRAYLLDLESGGALDVAPVGDGVVEQDAHVLFEAGQVELRHRRDGLAIRLRVTVAPGDDVELQEIEVANEGHRRRHIRVVGCLEPVLALERDAARHPAFSRLFLRTTPAPELDGAVVTRLGRDEHTTPRLAFRVVAGEDVPRRLLAIDRAAFFGRNGSVRRPAALASREEVGAEARTLDPLLACAADLRIEPGERRVVALVTAVARRRSEAVELARRYGSRYAVRWAFEDAGRGAARRLERLGVAPALLPAVQRLLSALLVPDPARRAPPPILATGRPSQPKLWGRGISGDDPIVVVRIDRTRSTDLLADVLAVHRYLQSVGVPFDVVVVDRAPTTYGDPAREELLRILAGHDATGLLHQRGGVHMVVADQASEAELADLAAAAYVHLDDALGPLDAQLRTRGERPVELPPFEPVGERAETGAEAGQAYDVPELDFDNGFGGFDGDEYVVRPDRTPPAPWCNVIANDRFGCLVTEASLGSTWSVNAGENRLTPWHNDPVLDPPSEVVYLRDEETGLIWSTTRQPAGRPTLVRHGQGYTRYASRRDGIEHEMTVFVPPRQPMKIVRLVLANRSSRPRRLTVTYYTEWVLGRQRAETRPWVFPDVSTGDACLMAHTSWSIDFADRVAFLASDRPMHGFTTDRVEMLGRGGGLADPAGLRRWGLSGRVAPALDPCAALQVHVDLAPGAEQEVHFFLGQVADRERALELVRRAREPGVVAEAWASCVAFWKELCDAVRVRTPDPSLDRLANVWLPYQTLSSRFFGRTALYQSSGAYGFRDQLQDALLCLHADPALARRHVLECAAHQFVEGDVLHWWHPPSDAGVRTRCSDDLLWLVYVTHEYVRATGDLDVLLERVPFLVGEPLGVGESSRYGRFERGEDGSLLEHCRRALARGFTHGPHGLPLIGDGDWNDGMDAVGSRGLGESVWLGWFVHACGERLAALLECVGGHDEVESWRTRLAPLRAALEEHGWDGGWYRRAYYDDGTPIGADGGEPPEIDSIAQSWAILSGAADEGRAAQALDAAERALVRADDRLVLLLTPPFDPHGAHDPGYIAAYPPGVRENGGQYTHAAAWLGFAHAARGDGAAAHRILSLLNPLERTRTPEGVERYRVEPYVIAADVYSTPPFVGRGGWTWYTGSAAWTWRLAVEAILGLSRRGGALHVDPCLPPGWDGFEAWVRSGGATVQVVVHNGGAGRGVRRVRLDDRPVERARVELDGAGDRRLEVWLGGPSEPPEAT